MKAKKDDTSLTNQYVTNDPLHLLFDAVQAISVQGYDQERRVIYWNEGSERLYGYTRQEAMGQKIEDLIIPPQMCEAVIAGHKNWLENNVEIPAAELELRKKNGHKVSVFSSHMMFTNQYNKKQMYCVDVDLTEVIKAQEQATFNEHMLRSVFNTVPDLFFLMDDIGFIVDFHANHEQTLYATPERFIGRNLADILPAKAAARFQTKLEVIKQQNDMLCIEYDLTLPQGVVYFEARISHLAEYNQFIAIIRDVTEQHKSAQLIRHQAYYDSLTSLPNRFLVLERLTDILEHPQAKHTTTTVLFLDIDDFKKVNDVFGHEIGDKLLIQSGNRLQKLLQQEDVVGRLGGDEFIVLISRLTRPECVLDLIKQILSEFRKPFSINGREIILSVSIGVSAYPENGTCPSVLLRNADTSMYQAKAMGGNTYSYFTNEMNLVMKRRFEVEEQLHGALARNEFEVYFQPQFDTNTQQLIGAEALLRWHSSHLGPISPVEFIPIAEHTGLIIPIGEFVIKQSLHFLANWQQEKQQNFTISVNLSPRQFRDPQLINFLKQAINQSAVDPQSVVLEITEGVLINGEAYIRQAFAEMSKLGVKLAMDDFGTGYSSLNYLRQYPFKELKIDRSFIDGITSNSSDRDLVKATIAMSHSLALRVVAEGVESIEQLHLLQELGCDLVQGYYFSQPLPKNQLLNYSANNQ
ncbi:EAL domain-containing protein [Paraglaciecola aquimarina]|uniref:EAL domain-containing protein n=1 Tax=Paraglaciecola aquimarina TaxID=1235557 RepID=A0ABU3SYW6_9ALTE|nr:EAL domain-containing protein [Paraglaciecola aquimarina]MDU0355210.1 EAL domain-containing protein [Paraglaciecola aquimarina]